MKKQKVSIIIVYFQGMDRLLSTLYSIQRHKSKINFEVIVVDNGGKRDTKRRIKSKFRFTKYIKSSGNIGFGAGNNLGAKEATGEYLFFLNPDTELQTGAIDQLVSFLDRNKRVAIVAPNLVDKSGKVFAQLGSLTLTPLRGIVGHSFINKLFPNNPISRKYWLFDVPMNKKREVDAVPGSAFLIRKKVFEDVGMFDENMFLFFEESDLGKRVKDAGYKIYIIPEAEVKHFWSSSKKSKKLKRYNQQSRFYYFKKHYGTVWAIIVEAFTRFSKWHVMLFLILFLALLLRFFRINTDMYMFGDTGWYYLSAKEMLVNGKVPLVGIPSSVPVLRQGALWTWMLAGALWLGKFNPIAGAYLSGLVGVIAVFGIYKINSTWFGKRVGIISALVVATSPFIVIHDRTPYQTIPIFLVTLLVAWSTYQIVQRNDIHYLLLGLWLSLLYQFELAGIILLPIVFIILFWQKAKINEINILRLVVGGLLGLLPFIVSDISTGVYLQTVGFGIWVITKVFEGMAGLFSGARDESLLVPGLDNIRNLIFGQSLTLAIAFLAISLVIFFFQLNRGNKKARFAKRLTLLWFVVGVASFFFRGTFSEAYVPILYLPIITLVSLSVNKIVEKIKIVGWILLSIIVVCNIIFIWNRLSNDKRITFSDRLEAVDLIIKDVGKRKYKLTYVGAGDHFESGNNHYHYLLWWKGNEPVLSSDLEYIIYESKSSPARSAEIVGEIDRKVAVYKKEK